MGFVNFSKKKTKVNGIVKYLKLEGWWLNELNDEERGVILEAYGHSIIEGNISRSSNTQLRFLYGLIGYFNKPELKHIAYKIIAKAETLIDERSRALDIHFLYGAKLDVCYKDRELSPNGLDIAIQACKQQIENAQAAVEAFKNEYGDDLPSHKGYHQLAIILEKQKRYGEAISLCEKAGSQGWAGDWDTRIERCNKRAAKLR